MYCYSYVVFAWHGPITLLLQVEVLKKINKTQQEDNDLSQKDTKDLWGEFSVLLSVYLSLHRTGPSIQVFLIFKTYSMFDTVRDIKMRNMQSFLKRLIF